MKRIIICMLAVISIAMVLTSCGNLNCSVCYNKCSDKHTFKDGEYILCDDCYNALFKDTVESEPETFFAE